MLKRLHVRNFTVFEDTDFEFSPGLNVIVGTNGTGKSHVLKLGYAVEAVRAEVEGQYIYRYKDVDKQEQNITLNNIEFDWLMHMQPTLTGVFLGSPLSIIRRATSVYEAEVVASFSQTDQELKFRIHEESPPINGRVFLDNVPSLQMKYDIMPVFIPPKEVLTLTSWLPSIYYKFSIDIDRTYINLSNQLNLPLLRELDPTVKLIINQLEVIMQGAIRSENNRFYLYPNDGERLEINMVAEGFRKLGTLAYLLGNGSLNKETTLYWDEPEANLNPALLRQLAALLVQMAAQGFQIILATHSLFLLKEFHILAQQMPEAKVRYFGLSAEPGEATRLATANNLELLPDIVALDAELEQSDRFQEVLDRGDADRN